MAGIVWEPVSILKELVRLERSGASQIEYLTFLRSLPWELAVEHYNKFLKIEVIRRTHTGITAHVIALNRSYGELEINGTFPKTSRSIECEFQTKFWRDSVKGILISESAFEWMNTELTVNENEDSILYMGKYREFYGFRTNFMGTYTNPSVIGDRVGD